MSEHESERVDIDLVKKNAKAQGIALSEIAILYEALTNDEKAVMRELNLLADESGDVVIGRFTESGDALFQKKIKGVHYLGA